MEILSDATFKGNVNISGGDFTVTRKGASSPLLTTNNYHSGLVINSGTCVFGGLYSDGNVRASNLWAESSIRLNNGVNDTISNWTDLNNILDFAPSSISTTVSSNTSKINSACSTISSLCTKVNSLCTTVSSNTNKINSLCTRVDNIQQNTKHAFINPELPVGCTKFYFVDNNWTSHYKFIVDRKDTLVSSVQVFNHGKSVQMDTQQYSSPCSGTGITTRWFEGILASNTTGYHASEFIITFDEFKELCTTETIPQ